MTVISTSPFAADKICPNFWQTPARMLRRLFSARVSRKFLTVASLPAPACLTSSATMADLSAEERLGAPRMVLSLVSFSSRVPRLARARAVGSRAEDLTAAVYCEMTQASS